MSNQVWCTVYVPEWTRRDQAWPRTCWYIPCTSMWALTSKHSVLVYALLFSSPVIESCVGCANSLSIHPRCPLPHYVGVCNQQEWHIWPKYCFREHWRACAQELLLLKPLLWLSRSLVSMAKNLVHVRMWVARYNWSCSPNYSLKLCNHFIGNFEQVAKYHAHMLSSCLDSRIQTWRCFLLISKHITKFPRMCLC